MRRERTLFNTMSLKTLTFKLTPQFENNPNLDIEEICNWGLLSDEEETKIHNKFINEEIEELNEKIRNLF
jgi:hypothetical protein